MVQDFEKQTGDFAFMTGFLAGFQVGRSIPYRKALSLLWNAPVGLTASIAEGLVSGFVQRRRGEHALRALERDRERARSGGRSGG